jgi:hypothetical protein
MDLLKVERIGGFAGFGSPGAHIRSRGQLAFGSLSEADQRSVDDLFKTYGTAKPSALRDGFSYRISRTVKSGTESIEVPEALLPAAIITCVKDELK